MIRSRYPLILALVFMLAACDAPAAPHTTQAPPVAESASPAPVAPPAEPTTAPLATPLPLSTPQPTMRVVATAVAYALTITDSLGRSLTLTAAPRRIVSLAPSNTEILFAVGAGEQVVGVTTYCNYPEAAQQREQIGGFSAKTISVETIVALMPDLVVAGDESQQEVIDALVGLKIPVMALKASTFEDVYRTIELIGQVTGHSEQASKVVAGMRTRVDAVTGKVAAIPQAERVSVFWEVFDEPLMTAGPSTFTGQMIELAGGVNVFADVTDEYPTISAEEVVKRDPAVILGPDSHADKLTPELIARRPGWSAIAATKSGRIAVIDGDMSTRAGPRLPEALEAIATALYPEVFK